MGIQPKDILNLIIRLSGKTYEEIGAAIKKHPEELKPENAKKNYAYAKKIVSDDIPLRKFLRIIEICEAELILKISENDFINFSNSADMKKFLETYLPIDIKKISSSDFITLLNKNHFDIFLKLNDESFLVDEEAINELNHYDFYDFKRQQIKEKYLAGMSAADIATEYNCSRSYIFLVLKQTGCKLRDDKGIKPKISKEQFFEDYKKVEIGIMSVEELKQKLNIKKDTFYRYRRMYLNEKSGSS